MWIASSPFPRAKAASGSPPWRELGLHRRAAGLRGGNPGFRHLRPQPADPAGDIRQAHRWRGRPFPHREIRSESSVHRLLVDPDQPLIWRGPLCTGSGTDAGRTRWGSLDVLFLDLPLPAPAPAMWQLTLAQKFIIDGALVVTTPQDIRAGGRAARRHHVPQGQCARAGRNRKHELLPLP